MQLIVLKNAYNQDLLKNSDQLTLLYQSRYDLLNARLQLLQQQIVAIQEVINQKKLGANSKPSRTSSATATK